MKNLANLLRKVPSQGHPPNVTFSLPGYRFTQSRTQLTLDHDILRTGPKVAEPRSVPESAPRERHNGDEFQKSIILTPTTTLAGNVQGPTQPRGDPYRRRTSVTDNVVPTSCAKQANVQITLRVQAASTRPTASPPAHNGHHARARWRRKPTTAKRLPCSRDHVLPHVLPLPLPAAQRVVRPCSSSWPSRP